VLVSVGLKDVRYLFAKCTAGSVGTVTSRPCWVLVPVC